MGLGLCLDPGRLASKPLSSAAAPLQAGLPGPLAPYPQQHPYGKPMPARSGVCQPPGGALTLRKVPLWAGQSHCHPEYRGQAFLSTQSTKGSLRRGTEPRCPGCTAVDTPGEGENVKGVDQGKEALLSWFSSPERCHSRAVRPSLESQPSLGL